ncbi:MAG: hypothetical protein U1C74_30005 [Phenylobacterium sp.]|nr:hypothetical protein [Phenylobacterium sp.]
MRVRVFARVWIAAWSLAGVAGGWLYHALYWRWRGCFNAEGRCFVEATGVVHHASSAILIVLPIVAAAAALLGVMVYLHAGRRRE